MRFRWWNILLFVPVLFAVVMFFGTIPYFQFDLREGFLGTKTYKVVNEPAFLLAFYTHISSSLLVWVCAIPQIIPYFIKRFPLFHQITGKIYVYLLLILAAPSGLVLAQFANGGLSAKIGFTLQSLLWWFVTFRAFWAIKNGDIEAHIKWIWRSIAITYAALALRSESYLMIQFFGTRPIETYLSVVWLSWVGNLLLIEILFFFGFEKFYLNSIRK